MEKKDSTNIAIPSSLAQKLEKRIKGTSFNSLSNYITYILRQVISKIETEEDEEKSFKKEDEEKIKERLRSLGYID